MEGVTKLLDWLVSLDIKSYKTTTTPEYVPKGKSHFYLSGSNIRFTSEDIVNIFNNEMSDELCNNWHEAIAHNVEWLGKQ